VRPKTSYFQNREGAHTSQDIDEEVEMVKQLHIVDTETCNGDGLCVEVCPKDVIEMVDEMAATVEGRAESCILCGQCVAVCHHSMLAALSLDLGTTIIGMIPPVVDRDKDLRARYGIPKDNRVLTSLILGYPKYRYRQGIRRDLAGVQFNSTVH